jgi:hypothetical protein
MDSAFMLFRSKSEYKNSPLMNALVHIAKV